MDAITTTLLTIASGLIAALSVHFLTLTRWRQDYRLKKLEELHTAVHNHEVAISEYYTRAALYCLKPEPVTENEKNELSNQEAALKSYLAQYQQDEKAASIIKLLIKAYFKRLWPLYEQFEIIVVKLRDENKKAVALMPEFRPKDITTEEANKISYTVGMTLIRVILPELNALSKELLDAIVEEVARIR